MTDQWLGRLYLGLALHRILADNADEARRLFLLAMSHLPNDPEAREDAAKAVAYQLINQPSEVRARVIDAASRIFYARNSSAKDFNRQLQVHVHPVQAFLALAESDASVARSSALKAVTLKPSLALNRGLISIIVGKPFRQQTRAVENRLRPEAGTTTRPDNHPSSSKERTLPARVILDIEQALQVQLKHVEPLATGHYTGCDFFRVYGNDQRYVVRLAGDQGLGESIPSLQIVRAAGVRAPQVFAYDDEQSTWLVEEEVPGRQFECAGLSFEQASACLTQLAESLCRLHQIKTNGFGRICDDQLNTTYTTFKEWSREYELLVEGSCVKGAVAEEMLAVLARSADYLRRSPAQSPVLCHGDLLSNVFVDGDRPDGAHLTGILDWGGACGGDPAFDLAWVELMIETAFPESQAIACLQDTFYSAYQLADEAVRRKVEPYALLLMAYLVGIRPKTERDRAWATLWRSQIGPLAERVDALLR